MNEDDREVLFNAWVGQHLALVGRVARSYVDTEEDCENWFRKSCSKSGFRFRDLSGRPSRLPGFTG